MILVHGIPLDYRSWAGQVQTLSGSFRTISYSRRCSFPSRCADYKASTVENNTIDLEGLIEEKGGGPVDLIGQSYGAAIVATCAQKRPDLVRRLVMIEAYLPGVVVDSKSRASQLALAAERPLVARSAKNSVENIRVAIQGVLQHNTRKALEEYYAGTWEHPEANRAIMLDNMGDFLELTNDPPTFSGQDAERMTLPTLLVTGEHTTLFMRAVMEGLHEKIPNSEIVTIRKAAHYPHLENPVVCGEAILKFLSRREG